MNGPVTAVMVLLSAGALAAPQTLLAQQAAPRATPDFNDAAFWAIVEAGAGTSAELEKVVSTYAAQGMIDEATRAFVRYLSRDELGTDPYCEFCQTLFSAGHRSAANPLLEPLIEATNAIVAESFASRSPDALLRLAVMTSTSSVREHRDRSLYFLTAAAQLGIDAAWQDEVVQLLANLGYTRDALAVASTIYADPSSMHYRSETIQQWIGYLSREIERKRQIGAMIVAAATRR